MRGNGKLHHALALTVWHRNIEKTTTEKYKYRTPSMEPEKADHNMAAALPNGDLETLLRNAADQVKSVQEQLTQAKQQIEDFTPEKTELQRTVTAGEERLIELKAKHELLKDVLSDKVRANDGLTADRDRLHVQLQSAKDGSHQLTQQVESMQASVETANTNVATMRDERDGLQRQLSSVNDRKDVLIKLETENTALKSDSESHNKNLTNLQDRLRKLDDENKAIWLEKCDLNATVEAKDKELVNIRKDRENRTKQLNNLQQANSSLKIIVELRDKAIAEASSTQQAQQQSLQESLNTKIKEVDEARSRHDIILTKLGDARAKLSRTEAAQRSLEDDVKVMRGTIQAYQDKEDGHQKKLNSIGKEKEELSQALIKARADIKAFHHDVETAWETHKTSIANLQQQKDDAVQEAQHANERQSLAEAQLTATQRKFTSLEADNKSLRTSRDVFRQEWEEKVRKQADMKLDIDTLSRKLSHTQQDNSRLSDQLRNVQIAIGACGTSNQDSTSSAEAITTVGTGDLGTTIAQEDTSCPLARTTPLSATSAEPSQRQIAAREVPAIGEDQARHGRRRELTLPTFVRLMKPEEDPEDFFEINRIEMGSAHPPDFGASLRSRLPRGHKGGIATHKLSACAWKLSDVDLNNVDEKVRRHALKYQAYQPVRDVTPITQIGSQMDGVDEGDPTSPETTTSHSSTDMKSFDSVIDIKHQLPADTNPGRRESSSEARRDSRREIDTMSKEESEAEPALPFGYTGLDRKRPFGDVDDDNMRFRKAVCRRCLFSKVQCSSMGQCSSCAGVGATCLYLHCQAGLGCRNARCNLLHPGQWSGKEKGEWSAA